MDIEILDDEPDGLKPQHVQYATFWRRVGAHLLDQFILSTATSMLVYTTRTQVEGYLLTICTGLITVAYKICLEKEYGQTLGKMITNIKVADDDFKPLTYVQVIKRNYFVIVSTAVTLLLVFNVFDVASFGPAGTSYSDVALAQVAHPLNLILGIIYCIDCLAITSNNTNKTLHDILANTIVIKKQA